MQRVLITGAGRGIGLELARQYAARAIVCWLGAAPSSARRDCAPWSRSGKVVIPGRVPDATDVVLNSLAVPLSSALVARWDARRTGRDTHDSGGRRRPGGATGGHDAAACGAGCALHVVGTTGGPSWLD